MSHQGLKSNDDQLKFKFKFKLGGNGELPPNAGSQAVISYYRLSFVIKQTCNRQPYR